MNIREIDNTETDKLLECVSALAMYHNNVSINFKGCYPSKPYKDTLKSFSKSLAKGTSLIAVIENFEKIVGFCKIDIQHHTGKLDYLIILPEYRGSGYGKELMDWAMAQFSKRNIAHIEVKVVDGNDVIHLYEKYGFRINAHILWFKSN